ncbi:MAG: FixH family protein [Alphaproteobacteria bacterium]|nr:FixH family protein [Alphaproteobacteria bacterium]
MTRLTGRHVAWMFGLFFAVVCAVNLVFALVATGTWTGLVVPDSYVASQRYNAVLRQAAEQQALGWDGRLRVSATGLDFTLTNRDGTPVPLGAVALRLERPVGTGEDTGGQMRIDGDRGVFGPPPGPGVWNVRVDAVAVDGTRFRLEQRISVDAPG